MQNYNVIFRSISRFLHPAVQRSSSSLQTIIMSSDGDKQPAEETSESVNASSAPSPETELTVTIGATVPTGFEHTAAEEVKEKIGVDARVSRDRGRIYFPVSTDKLFQVQISPGTSVLTSLLVE